MRETYTTCKVTPDVLAMIRVTAGKTGEKQYGLLRRLLRAEMKQQGIKLPKAT